MATVNLRELDDALVRRAKIAAATDGVTLKDWVLDAMERKLGGGQGTSRDSKTPTTIASTGTKKSPVATKSVGSAAKPTVKKEKLEAPQHEHVSETEREWIIREGRCTHRTGSICDDCKKEFKIK